MFDCACGSCLTDFIFFNISLPTANKDTFYKETESKMSMYCIVIDLGLSLSYFGDISFPIAAFR